MTHPGEPPGPCDPRSVPRIRFGAVYVEFGRFEDKIFLNCAGVDEIFFEEVSKNRLPPPQKKMTPPQFKIVANFGC